MTLLNPQHLATHKKKEVKTKWMVMDAIKNNLIPHISKKKMTKEMFDAPVSLYQSENINRKIILLNILRSVEMTRSNTITSYLMKVTPIHDQLAMVGEKFEEKELVNQELNRFPSQWEAFVHRRLCLGKTSLMGKTMG